jgi:hypothetical protein
MMRRKCSKQIEEAGVTTVAATTNYFRLEIELKGNHPPTMAEIMNTAQPVVAWQIQDGVCLPLTPAPRAMDKQICAVLCPTGVIIENGQAYKNFDLWLADLSRRWNAARAARRVA